MYMSNMYCYHSFSLIFLYTLLTFSVKSFAIIHVEDLKCSRREGEDLFDGKSMVVGFGDRQPVFIDNL